MERVKIQLSQRQSEFIRSNALLRAFCGGRGAGKSFVGAYDLLRRAKPGRNYEVVTHTNKALRDFTLPPFFQLSEKLRLLRHYHETHMIAYLGNGAQVKFRTAEDPDSLRGGSVSGVWMDEASLVKEKALLNLLPKLREGGEIGWLSATYTPMGKGHWTYERFAPDEHGNLPPFTEHFHLRTRDNPFLAKGLDQITRQLYTSHMSRQELDAEYTDAAGQVFEAGWFTKRVQDAPVEAAFIRYWDKAGTEAEDGDDDSKGPAATAGVLVAKDNFNRYFIVDVIRGRWGYAERDARIKLTAAEDQRRYGHVRIWIEQEPGSGGKQSAEVSIKDLAGYDAHVERPVDKKETRWQPLAAQAEVGNVYIVEGEWNSAFIDELVSLPKGRRDQADAAAGAFNKLALGGVFGEVIGGKPGEGIPAGSGVGKYTPGGLQRLLKGRF